MTPSLQIQCRAKVRSAMSMLYTDILSQELSDALTSPHMIGLVQKYLKNKNPEDLDPTMLPPLLESVPQSVIHVAQEAVFSSGALSKTLDCQYELKVGDPLYITQKNVLLQLEMRDGRLTSVIPNDTKAKAKLR